MGFFDFLKPIEHTVGHAAASGFSFLSNAVPGTAQVHQAQQKVKDVNAQVAQLPQQAQQQIQTSPQYKAAQNIPDNPATIARNLAVATVRAPIRAGATVGKSIADVTNPALGLPVTPAFDPSNNPVSEALLGKEPIKSAQQRESETQKKLSNSSVKTIAAPLAFLGTTASIGLDATPLGGKGKASLEQLAKATTEKEVRKIMEGTPQAIIDKVAPAIAQTKDPGVIDNIITKATVPGAGHAPTGRDVSAIPEAQIVPPPPENVTPAPAELPSGPKERGYTTSQKAADQYSPELKAAIGGDYVPAGDKPAFDAANRLIDKQGVDATHQQILEKLQSGEQATKQDVITGGTVISHLDSQGRVAEAEQLHQLLAEKGTAGGQTSQAFGALLRRTPEGIVYKAKNDITKAGGQVTPEIEQTLNNFKENLKGTAPGSPEREEGVTQLGQYVAKQVPSSATDKIFSVWRAGLLTGPQTVAKIITSHIVHGGLEDIKDIPGAAVDKFISLFTKQRALTATERGSVTGAKQGVSAGKELFTTGKDINPGSNAEELRQTVNFGKGTAAKVFQKYVDTVGNVHGSLYKPFYGKAYVQSLYNTALAEAKNRHLTGAEKDDFIQAVVTDPSAEVAKIAKRDAENATFQQETALGNIASAIQKKGGIVGKVIAPFTRIPSAIATDLFNYSPAGLAKTVIDGIKHASSKEGLTFETQRQLSQGIGRGLVGSAVILPGIYLYNRGLMTLDYPTDPKEQKLWQLEGKVPNAIKVGGQWRGLGSIGPGGSVLSIGGHFAKSIAEGNDFGSSLIAGFSGGARSIEEQSYLQGISGALNAVNEPGRYAPNFIKSEAGSVIPTISNTVAASTDKYSRKTNTPLDAIKNRVPGLRESLAPKVNALGQPVLAGETGIEKLIDPFQSSTVRSSKVTEELRRLQDAGQGILPSTINKKTTFNSVNTKLTPEQQQELTKTIGQATLKKWQEIISKPGYQNASDQQKSARLKSVYDVVAQHQKILFAKEQKVGRYSPDYATNRKQAKANKKFVAK